MRPSPRVLMMRNLSHMANCGDCTWRNGRYMCPPHPSSQIHTATARDGLVDGRVRHHSIASLHECLLAEIAHRCELHYSPTAIISTSGGVHQHQYPTVVVRGYGRIRQLVTAPAQRRGQRRTPILHVRLCAQIAYRATIDIHHFTRIGR